MAEPTKQETERVFRVLKSQKANKVGAYQQQPISPRTHTAALDLLRL